ncbi:MAG TPA: FxsA family protein [Acidimicrobiia bacterium]|nr:FxsA family protein [Acidimicrobiia bacterium]
MRFLTLFALVALAEMLTFFWLGSRIGLGWALGLALVTALVGSYLVRRAGLSVWRRISRKLNGGELPGRELSDGAAILVAGAFLISPGFITDTLGFLLLLPPVRDFIYRTVAKRFRSRVTVFTSNFSTMTREPIQGEVIDVDAEEVDPL